MGKNVRGLPGGNGQNVVERHKGDMEHAPGGEGRVYKDVNSPQSPYKPNSILTRILAWLFSELGELILKCMWKSRGF